MRSVRTFATGAAIAAALLLGAPAVAHADVTSDSGSHEKAWDGSDKEAKDSSKEAKPTEEHSKGDKEEKSDYAKPHGGVHTGGGGLVSGSGAATGAVLLAGGIGVSALAMRRRRTGRSVGAAV
ncbi:hypothetical protein OG871_34980 [Kitasatospora sp. NBC_00374]|uniref:hypothetical protein n=1 Tax=Kitasatospora sp. NBC_00374 TaxID=2975964 RepID=UPI0032568734